MDEQTISQRNAVENAWLAAKHAEFLISRGNVADGQAYCELAQAWAAIASQLEFVTEAATETELGHPADTAPDLLQRIDPPLATEIVTFESGDGYVAEARAYQNSEHARPLPRPLRDGDVQVSAATEQLEQTVSLPRVVEPDSARPALCHCIPGGAGGHEYSKGRCW